MKCALVLLALIAGSLAQFTIAPYKCEDNAFACAFKDLGNQLKSTLSNIRDALKNVGKGFLGQVAQTGASLLKTGTQALANTVTNSLDDLPPIGRRSLLQMQGKAVAALHNFVGKVKAGYDKAVDGLMDVAHKLATYQVAKGDVVKDVTDLVDEFKALTQHAEVQRRNVFDDFKNNLASLKDNIGDFLQPHVENLASSVSSLGNTLKGHASNLLDTLKVHATTLGDKLKEHASTLSGQAKTALEQLKASVTDILSQTASKVGDTVVSAAGDVVTGVVNAGADVAGN